MPNMTELFIQHHGRHPDPASEVEQWAYENMQQLVSSKAAKPITNSDVSEAHYVQTVRISTGEPLEVYRVPGGGIFGIDGSFLEQVKDNESDLIIEPINGMPVKLVD